VTLNTLDSFTYLGTMVTDKGSQSKVSARIAKTTGALSNINRSDENIRISKIRLMRFLVTSIFLYGESYTLTADLERQ